MRLCVLLALLVACPTIAAAHIFEGAEHEFGSGENYDDVRQTVAETRAELGSELLKAIEPYARAQQRKFDVFADIKLSPAECLGPPKARICIAGYVDGIIFSALTKNGRPLKVHLVISRDSVQDPKAIGRAINAFGISVARLKTQAELDKFAMIGGMCALSRSRLDQVLDGPLSMTTTGTGCVIEWDLDTDLLVDPDQGADLVSPSGQINPTTPITPTAPAVIAPAAPIAAKLSESEAIGVWVATRPPPLCKFQIDQAKYRDANDAPITGLLDSTILAVNAYDENPVAFCQTVEQIASIHGLVTRASPAAPRVARVPIALSTADIWRNRPSAGHPVKAGMLPGSPVTIAACDAFFNTRPSDTGLTESEFDGRFKECSTVPGTTVSASLARISQSR
jgi:hypothetical protein